MSGDLISRQAVLELVADYDLSMGQVVRGIHALPSVNPQEPKTDTLDRIKAEMHETAEKHEDGDWYLREEWVVDIIDKYKAEIE